MRYVYLLAFFTTLWTCFVSPAGAPLNGRRRMHQFGEQFREFDQDRNGVVDAQEIRSALGIMPTRFVDMFLKRVDVDQDGKSTCWPMGFSLALVSGISSVRAIVDSHSLDMLIRPAERSFIHVVLFSFSRRVS
ncbi:hypothetical protein FOZ60_001923 [Perkinsus olseni]|uniref:EF-hand domain-containing protein n=1 Tax=Perkinsus olseni TaxID=32597 RepID=A0A7J6P1S2_PEROL|nr:hypothetical protein FOZ60_001923 [Perkinsus olseni]